MGDEWQHSLGSEEQGGKSDIRKDFLFMVSSIGRVLWRVVFQIR